MRTSLRNPFTLRGFALLLLWVLCAGRSFAAEPEFVDVPDVIGKTRAEALTTLEAQGFLVGVYEIAGEPADTVAAQMPAARQTLPPGGIVLVQVRRKTSEPTSAPKATGLPIADAVNALGRLYVLELVPVAGPPAERGRIVEQTPALGQPLALRGTLTLKFVPDPMLPATVSAPSVAGLTTAEAIDAMSAAGLQARVVETSVPGAPVDLCVGQVPLPGTELPRYGSAWIVVTIAVPDAPPPPTGEVLVTTPNVIGMSEASARAALDQAGLPASVEWIDGPNEQAFLVQTQDPAAETQVPEGSEVHLRIVRFSSGGLPPPPIDPGQPPSPQVTVPDLIGRSQTQAEEILSSLGLLSAPILETNSASLPLRVFAQKEVPGTVVLLGTTITYRVAKPLPPPQPVPVPDLYGRTVGNALAASAQAGLGLSVTYVTTAAHPPYRVYAQNVPAWTIVPLGTTILVKVAKPPAGPSTVLVPNLTGKTEGQAMSILATAGLVGDATSVNAPGKPPFQVFAQNPAVGAQVPTGTVVHFQVAKPLLGWKVVPDVTNKPVAVAENLLLAAGFQPQVEKVQALLKPAGIVFWQSPIGGTLRPQGSTITIRIPKLLVVQVPNVVGKMEGQAQAILSAAGFGVQSSYVISIGNPPGKVLGQNPAGNANVAPGTLVTLQVASGFLPQKKPVPSVLGKTKAQATAILAAQGFQVQFVDQLNPAADPGEVFAQDPLPGALRNPGSTVTAQVAIGQLLAKVPAVVGMQRAQAEQLLLQANLTVKKVFVPGPLLQNDKVTAQSIVAGTKVPPGTQVTIQVIQGQFAQLAKVPNLIGLTPQQAKAALEAKGLVSVGIAQIAFGKPHGKVFSQNTPVGQNVAVGTQITWRWNP